ncbi:ankyrin repeat family A protein 2-like isoform X3 [Stegodyphus dumicola]|uniref:ankyrin repeat family A protein 2-like isoform X3 n=1 Tax=Stegodyphus dumicola TaxID=202533 RepID=UPI0015AF4481|nr:ankyrin repeat family A protein 2-like isoform X3 [Stegodyphus dumicola]
MPSSLLLKESTGHDTTTSFSISALNRDGTCSAFSPYKPTTVLTNLQRGNVQTQTPSVLPERSLHQLAAQGELFLQNLDDNFNVNLQDENGFTPLMWASSYGQLETEGNTALMYAAYNNHSGCTQELLNAGADLTAMNETFDSAYDIAVKRRSKNAQAVMEKYMLSIMSEAKMKQ